MGQPDSHLICAPAYISLSFFAIPLLFRDAWILGCSFSSFFRVCIVLVCKRFDVASNCYASVVLLWLNFPLQSVMASLTSGFSDGVSFLLHTMHGAGVNISWHDNHLICRSNSSLAVFSLQPSMGSLTFGVNDRDFSLPFPRLLHRFFYKAVTSDVLLMDGFVSKMIIVYVNKCHDLLTSSFLSRFHVFTEIWDLWQCF